MSFDIILPAGWSIKTVEELIKDEVIEKPLDGNHGGTHPKASDYVSDGIPFVMASDLIKGQIDFKKCKYITKEQADSLRKGFSRAGDVLLSHKATIGRTALVQDNKYEYVMLTPQVTYYRVKNHKLLSNRYLKYYFDSTIFQNLLNAWSGSGSTRAYLGITNQLKLPVIMPPIEYQRYIDKVAGRLDDKIYNSVDINSVLGNMVNTLYKSWFVDFDPVYAKVNKNKSKEFANEVFDVFPDGLEEMGGTKIPKGWTKGTLADLCTLNSKSWTSKNKPSEINYVDLANTKHGIIEETTRYTWSDAPSRAKRVIKNGDTIIGTVRPGNRSFSYILNQEEQLTASTGFAVLTPKKEVYREFTYVSSTRDEAIDYFAHLADGGAYPAINGADIVDLEIVIPNDETLIKFHEIVKPFFLSIKNNEKEGEYLKDLRNTLLSKLLTGEIELN